MDEIESVFAAVLDGRQHISECIFALHAVHESLLSSDGHGGGGGEEHDGDEGSDTGGGSAVGFGLPRTMLRTLPSNLLSLLHMSHAIDDELAHEVVVLSLRCLLLLLDSQQTERTASAIATPRAAVMLTRVFAAASDEQVLSMLLKIASAVAEVQPIVWLRSGWLEHALHLAPKLPRDRQVRPCHMPLHMHMLFSPLNVVSTFVLMHTLHSLPCAGCGIHVFAGCDGNLRFQR